MIDPQRGEEKKIETIREELNKRYQPLLKKVVEVSEKLESQEELINVLNKMNAENSQLVQQTAEAAEMLNKIKAEMNGMEDKEM